MIGTGLTVAGALLACAAGLLTLATLGVVVGLAVTRTRGEDS